MDPSNTSSMNGTHLQQPYNGSSSYGFLSDIEAYASANDGLSGSDNYNFAWDPALFAEGDSGSSFPQQQQQTQQQPMSVNLNQTLSRPSNSPALQHQQQLQHQQPSSPPLPQSQSQSQPQQQQQQQQQQPPPQQQTQSQSQHHHSSQPSYAQGSYSHSLYEHRNMAQPSFDERFMSRPSASPTPFDHSQGYQQMSYNYSYQQPYQRQASTPTSFYNQRPIQQQMPQSQSMMNMNSRPSPQLSQSQQTDNMQFHQYPSSQRMTHAFVNPSMISSGHHMAMNGSQQSTQGLQSQQHYQNSPYFQKAGSTVDPQILHAMQMQSYSPIPTPVPQSMQQHNSVSQPFQPQNQADPAQMQQLAAAKIAPLSKSKDPAASKKTKTKTSKVRKDGGSETDSSDDLEIEDEPPEEKPALLIVSSPTDEKVKAMYHAVEAVWYPRNKSPKAEDIRKGIATFGETVRSLRDAWKAKNETLKKAELPNSDNTDQVPRLKDDVAHYRQTMESVMMRSIQYGHEAIVKRLGENQFTLSALYSFLLDRANVGDYESSLVNSIFKFAVKFETLDEEMLEQVKWSKILHRWTKKATNESKEYAKQILANAAATTARKRAAGADGAPGSPASVNGTKRDGTAGVKRLREGDAAAAPAPKKVVKPASKPLALQSAERRKALERESLQKGGASKSEKGAASASSTVASRPKVAMTAPSKANAFAGLLSASKKPGTSNAEKAKAAAVAKERASDLSASTSSVTLGPTTTNKDEMKKDYSPPRNLGPGANKSATSFLGFLKDMDKPKETETKKAEVDPNETEEQRAKRVRKEERRKLRVTWKPDNDLVQTKLFTHDPEEETGQTDNMMRDAGDTMKEGEMLKRHIGVDDVDEDEEEDPLGDTEEYSLPSEVDFSVIDADRSANFVKFGGPINPESSASEAQTKYEENTLMTTYTLKTDRPATPKELSSINDDDDDDNFQPIVDFGEPSDHVRRREKDLLTRKTSDVAAVAAAPPASAPPSTDLAAQLRALGMQQSQPPQPTAFNASMFSQQPNQQPSVPTSGTNPDLSKLLAVMQQYSQMQQSQPSNPPPQPQAPPSFQATASNINPNLAAIVAQVSGQQNVGLPLGSANNPNPFPGSSDFGRKHGRAEETTATDQSNKKKKKATDGKPYNYKTVTCQFWLEGKCTKGENCTYKHEV